MESGGANGGSVDSADKACLWFASCRTLEGKLYNLLVSIFLYEIEETAILYLFSIAV